MPIGPATRLCVALTRQRPADAYTIDEVASDARAIVSHAIKIRRALARQKQPDKSVIAIEEIAAKYGAQVVPNFDLEGTVIGMRFPTGYSSGFRNVFPVT